LPFEDYRRQMEDWLLAERLIGLEVAPRIQISAAEIRSYYEANRNTFTREETFELREIRAASRASADAIASETRRRKESFANLARRYSVAETAADGGKLPLYRRGQLRPEIEAALLDQPVGSVAGPFPVGDGYEIVQLEKHVPPGTATLEDVQEEIAGRIYQEKLTPARRTYLDKLRADAFLEIRPGFEDAGAIASKNTTWRAPILMAPETTTVEELHLKRKRKWPW